MMWNLSKIKQPTIPAEKLYYISEYYYVIYSEQFCISSENIPLWKEAQPPSQSVSFVAGLRSIPSTVGKESNSTYAFFSHKMY